MEVRRITSLDAERLRQVRLAALQDAPSAFGSTFAAESSRSQAGWALRADAGSQGSDRATFFAELDGEVVGLAGGYREEPASSVVELVSVWVAPSARGRGVGALLVDAVVAWAAETNASTVALWVTCGNTPAERVYESCGFVATGEVALLPSDPSLEESRMVLTAAMISGAHSNRG